MNTQETYARFAKFYDAYTADYADDIPFYLAAVAGTQPPLLEVGCGSGRILVPLLRAGHTVAGVDISQEMLALAQSKLLQEPLGRNCDLVLHDFAQGHLPGQYGAALVTFYTFNYIHPNERLAFIRHIRQNLMEGAPIILHLFYPVTLAHPELENMWQDKGCYRIDGEEVRLYDCRRMRDGHTEERWQRYEMSTGASEEIHTVRYYLSPLEMAELLIAAGFAQVRVGWDLKFEHLKPLAELDGPSGEYMVVAEMLSTSDYDS
jgi:SAM-dependent methyltransferase